MNNKTLFETISKALAVCMPETYEESQMSCPECPLYEICKDEECFTLPVSLVGMIKQYFSNNWDNRFVQ